MVLLKCHNCPHEVNIEPKPLEWGCSECGAVNEVPLTDGTADQACGCLAPPGWAGWDLPAGDHEDAMGRMWYKTAQGNWLTEEQYTKQLGLNPRIAKEAMRKFGREGRPGHHNTSTLRQKA